MEIIGNSCSIFYTAANTWLLRVMSPFRRPPSSHFGGVCGHFARPQPLLTFHQVMMNSGTLGHSSSHLRPVATSRQFARPHSCGHCTRCSRPVVTSRGHIPVISLLGEDKLGNGGALEASNSRPVATSRGLSVVTAPNQISELATGHF